MDGRKSESPIDPWPDWRDAGKRVELRMPDGQILRGELIIEDVFFNGEDEIPMFAVTLDDGSRASFVDAEEWKFI